MLKASLRRRARSLQERACASVPIGRFDPQLCFFLNKICDQTVGYEQPSLNLATNVSLTL